VSFQPFVRLEKTVRHALEAEANLLLTALPDTTTHAVCFDPIRRG
jgi:hypothetical protein